jgi:RNA ligase (TIGR02306 family)
MTITNREIYTPSHLPIKIKYSHPNADRLEVLHIAGFKTVVACGLYSIPEEVLFFEPGTAFTIAEATRLGINKYLNEKTDINGDRVLVIREVKLRGIMSEGLILPLETVMVKEEIFKFKPPASKFTMADAAKDNANFPQYGSLENLRRYPNAIPEGAPVYITEKIHGTNSRVGFVRSQTSEEPCSMVLMAGSRTVNRKPPEPGSSSLYWMPYELQPGINALFKFLFEEGYDSATLYGELFGPSIQSYSYGLAQKVVKYRAFTLKINGKVCEPELFQDWMALFNIEVAPIIEGPFAYSYEEVASLAEGPSLIRQASFADHKREGVVVQWGHGIFKYVCDSYLLGKGQKLETTDL